MWRARQLLYLSNRVNRRSKPRRSLHGLDKMHQRDINCSMRELQVIAMDAELLLITVHLVRGENNVRYNSLLVCLHALCIRHLSAAWNVTRINFKKGVQAPRLWAHLKPQISVGCTTQIPQQSSFFVKVQWTRHTIDERQVHHVRNSTLRLPSIVGNCHGDK
jgi:hypothetical protein